MDAHLPMPNVDTATSVEDAAEQVTDNLTVMQKRNRSFGLHPKYLRYNLWSKSTNLLPTTAEWSTTACPLPRPPINALSDPISSATISNHSDLFKIITPINVDTFESLLSTHPNPAFCHSVCTALREGFWPWANTTLPYYPSTHDASQPPPNDEGKASFLRSQRDIEVAKERFSPPFGQDLLPGMFSMPIFAVPKHDSDDFRLVTDQSASSFSLNGMVQHDCVTGFSLDNMKHIGEMISHFRRENPNSKLVMWKSDIAEAYRLIPMHPFWQIKQVNTIDGLRYIDRNNSFGNSASGALFISFNSLVAWIAKNICHLDYLANYIDDSTGCDIEGDTAYYPPYDKHLPRHQKIMLELWDTLGIPHKEKKQVSGSPLTVIGISVDPNRMTLTLPSEARRRLLDELLLWTVEPGFARNLPKFEETSLLILAASQDTALALGIDLTDRAQYELVKKAKPHFKLKRWQQLAGWLNWAFNVFPLLRPALNNFYPKLVDKSKPDCKIYTNVTIREDLRWAASHIRSSDGVHLLQSRHWSQKEADFVFYCDTSLSGMAFWDKNHNIGYYSPINEDIPIKPDQIIFFYEALSLLSALDEVANFAPPNSKIIIFTDNSNTFDIFNSLRCLPLFNPMLRQAADILIGNPYQLRVLYIPTKENVIADSLSRADFAKAISAAPGLTIRDFTPP